MTYAGHDDERPRRIGARRGHSGPDGHQAVARAVNQQDRASDHADTAQVCPPAARVACRSDDGTRGIGELLLDIAEIQATAGHLDMLRQNVCGHPCGVDAAQREHARYEFLRGQPTAAAYQYLADARRSVGGEHRGHDRVRTDGHKRQGRVDKHQAGDGAWRGARLEQRDHPAHRVAYQDHLAAGHGLDETVQQTPIRRHRRAASAGFGEAVSGEVWGEYAVAAGQQRGDR